MVVGWLAWGVLNVSGLAAPTAVTPPPSISARGLARAPAESPERVAALFFAAIRARRYSDAYACLSPAAQRDLSYGDFAERSGAIKAIRILRFDSYERGPFLARFRVKGRLEIVYRGQRYRATYAGRATMSRGSGHWRVEAVELKPVDQKRMGPAYQV